MKITRRQFLKGSAAAGAFMAVGGVKGLFAPRQAYAFAQSPNLQKFIQPLRRFGVDIPIATPDPVPQPWWQPGVAHYTIDIGQFTDQLHPALPKQTTLWGYGQGYSATNPNWTRHLGGLIVAQRGTPVQVTFQNRLPNVPIVPVDTTSFFMDAALNGFDRASVHLHGGFTPWISDGTPMQWWRPNGQTGPSFAGHVLNPGALPYQAEQYYPSQESARMMWYHDHAHDTTRTNAYAGLATGYVITDAYEAALAGAPYYLPGPLDPRTFHLVFQDKGFVPPNIAQVDPSWPTIMPNNLPGDLWYPHFYDPARWAVGPQPNGAPPDPSCVPEAFGDTMLVNGTVYPYLEVEQRQYRFRALNACNARFVRPKLVYAQSNVIGSPGSTEPRTAAAGPPFIQVGNEGGFLPAPAMLNGPLQPRLVLAPAERADWIVDFRNVPVGSILILYSDAPAPFPMGDSRNDYFPGNPNTPSSVRGFGPNTRTLLQFRVKARSGPADPPISLPTAFTPLEPFLVNQTPGVPIVPVPNAQGFANVTLADGTTVQARYVRLTLNETFDGWGRLTQYLGTDVPTGLGGPGQFGRQYMDFPTEISPKDSFEVWEVVNLTGDTHPIHYHLMHWALLSRQRFNAVNYAGGKPAYIGPATGPDANECGFKETFRMNPGQVTRVLVKFAMPTVPFTVPSSPIMAPPPPYKKVHEYVWHCHILDHEEHDMMRPMIVVE